MFISLFGDEEIPLTVIHSEIRFTQPEEPWPVTPPSRPTAQAEGGTHDDDM